MSENKSEEILQTAGEKTEPVNIESTEEKVDVTAEDVSRPKGHWHIHLSPKARNVVVLLTVAALIVAGGVGYMLGHRQTKAPVSNVKNAQPVKPTQKVTSSMLASGPQLEKFIHPTTGETWYDTPKSIALQGWFEEEDRESYNQPGVNAADAEQQYQDMLPEYYEVGSRNDRAILMVKLKTPIGTAYARFFERAADGSVTAIVKPSATATYDDYYVPGFKTGFIEGKITNFDESTHYDSLSLPTSFKLENGETVTSDNSPSYGFGNMFRAQGTTETAVMSLGSNTLYRTEKKYADTKLTNIGYVVRTKMGPEMEVDYVPNTKSLEKYSFSNGKAATYTDYNGVQQFDSIHAIAKGCGGTTAAVTRADGVSDGDLVEVGKTDTGRTVYGMKDTSNMLLSKAYDEYKQANGTNAVSLAAFVEAHGLMIIKNSAGELLVYVRDQYGNYGGCAKPVVYLYPTAATQVSVRVGANVTVSDPQYETNGWQGVWAEPSGRLTYHGQTYESLFWEGQGIGDYPAITSGTVVKRADAAAIMRRQLSEQGLNQKEANDFMAYWQPKIPNKPYIRLTWFNTAQMNKLAPLTVSPKPATFIRVFLDMDGFDTPPILQKQHLTKANRTGFTVVEWGGLSHFAQPN